MPDDKVEEKEALSHQPREHRNSTAFNYLHLDPDKVLSAFGKYGKMQMLAYFITTSVQMLFAINVMVMPFITADPSFDCDFKPDPEWVYEKVDSCHIKDGNNWTVTCLQIPGAKYTYNNSEGISSIAAQFDLVCDQSASVAHGTSVFMLGGMLVSPIITQLSDLFGRRLTFLVPLYIAVIANVVCAFAPTFYIFLFCRFLSGVATTSFSIIGSVLCMESVALDFRSLIPLVATITWVIGYTLAGVLQIFIKDWRWLYFAISIPGTLTIPFYWLTPESLHWLITKKKDTHVRKFIKTCSKFNNIEISLSECKTSSAFPDVESKRTFLDVFLNPQILIHLLLNAYILIVMNGTYWALSLFSTELSEDGITGYFLSGLIELPAGLLSVVLLVCFNRKTVSFVSLLLTASFMLLALYLPVGDSVKMIFPLLAKSCNAIVWSSQPLLYSESVPTSIRNVFCGIVSFLGDFGSVAAPYLKVLESIHKNAPQILIASMSIVAALFVLLLPETKGKKLPEDIGDFEGGPLLRRFRKGIRTPSEESVPLEDIKTVE